MRIKFVMITFSAILALGSALAVSQKLSDSMVFAENEESAMSINQDTSQFNSLAIYQGVMDEFNQQYGTEYQIESDEILKDEGSNREELEMFFSSMSKEEFWSYLYDAYLSDQFSDLEDLDGKKVVANNQF